MPGIRGVIGIPAAETSSGSIDPALNGNANMSNAKSTNSLQAFIIKRIRMDEGDSRAELKSKKVISLGDMGL